jgi:hypothetical protein
MAVIMKDMIILLFSFQPMIIYLTGAAVNRCHEGMLWCLREKRNRPPMAVSKLLMVPVTYFFLCLHEFTENVQANRGHSSRIALTKNNYYHIPPVEKHHLGYGLDGSIDGKRRGELVGV